MTTFVNPAMMAEPFDMSGRTLTVPANSVGQSAVAAGVVVQVVSAITGAVATGTGTISFADSVPTSTAGNEYLTATITPKGASNILIVDVSVILSTSFVGTTAMTALLFRDAGTSAIAAGTQLSPAANSPVTVSFRFQTTAVSLSATTFRVRGGASGAGTTTFNGNAGTRGLGGVLCSSIVITEVKA
jgi:hypothetical protein